MDISVVKIINLLTSIHSENMLIYNAVLSTAGVQREKIDKAIDELNRRYEEELYK